MREDYCRGREKKKGEKRRRKGRKGKGGRSEVEEFVITDMSSGSSEFVD